VYAALHVHGRTIPAGCGATVGIAGLTLAGGIGLLGRKHGLTCDRLVGARVVLADGRIVDCDADREPELFWALRGADGGQFGVVTSLDDCATAYHAGNHPRLAAANKAYDPDRLFEFPQSI
jgi:FAD/FMN-containing dehydrogenase